MLPGGRKSVEPMAARVQPQNVRSAHQSMYHLVADTEWSDAALLAAVAAQVLPVLTKASKRCHWIVDATDLRRKASIRSGLRANTAVVWADGQLSDRGESVDCE